MTKEEFISLLQIYGTDITRWPHGTERDAAAHLAAHASDIEKESALDAALDSYVIAPQGADLLERMMDAVHSKPSMASDQQPRWHMPVMLACAIIGLWCGNTTLQTQSAQGSTWQQPLNALFGATTFSEVTL